MSTDLAAANIKYFDTIKDIGHPDANRLVENLVPAILGAYPFSKAETALLDFGCGLGMISRCIAPHARKTLGVDISPASVDKFNQWAKDHSYAPDEMQAIVAELKGKSGELDDQRFDIVISTMVYHHLDDLNAISGILAHYLKPGGLLLVVDQMVPADGESIYPDSFKDKVPHLAGISESTMIQAFEGAGLKEFKYNFVMDFSWEGGKAQELFIASAVKPL